MLVELIQVRELKFLLNRWALMQRHIEKPFNRTSLEKLYKALNVFPNDERLSGQELHEQLRYAVF